MPLGSGAGREKWPLTATSPSYAHVLQSVSLLLLAVTCVPLSTLILVASYAITLSRAARSRLRIRRHGGSGLTSPSSPSSFSSSSSSSLLTAKEPTCADPTPTPAPAPKRRILVTGVGMSKGLFIARAFHAAGHDVTGADFEPHGIPVCGRFSSSLRRFYRLPSPSPSLAQPPSPSADVGAAAVNAHRYITRILEIVQEHRIDLWVSCSGVVSALEDAAASEAVERHTGCRAVQFGVDVTRRLHEKHSFVEQTARLGLRVPETQLVTSAEAAMDFLLLAASSSSRPGGGGGRRYILKSVGVDDAGRADITTLLPLASRAASREHLARLRLAPSRPFIVQRFVRGREYCTHSVVIRGRVKAFTACRSAELLMHYEPLPAGDEVFRALLRYTELYMARMERDISGHFSIDFLLDEEEDEMDQKTGLDERLFPIECNPRAHTAVVNFGDDTKGMVDAYLSLLEEEEESHQTPSQTSFPQTSSHQPPITLSTSSTKHYWLGHDIVTRLCLPLLSWATASSTSSAQLLGHWSEFVVHVATWRDPTFEARDPWPAWWLYCGYWPAVLVVTVVQKRWWSRCNVSTGKMFGL